MRVLSIQDTSITSLFLIGSSSGLPSVFQAASKVVERYQFRKAPSAEELVSNKQVFGQGLFNGQPINSFEVYTDGLVVRAMVPTETLDEFVADLVEMVGTELGMHRIETHTAGKIYESNLMVECDPNVLRVLEPLQSIAAMVSSELTKASGQKTNFGPIGYAFGVDQAKASGLKGVPFRLERRLGTDFDKNIFISSASLPTQAHIRVLEKLERLA